MMSIFKTQLKFHLQHGRHAYGEADTADLQFGLGLEQSPIQD